MLSSEDKIMNKTLGNLRFSAQRQVTEYHCMDDFLHKLRTITSIECITGSRRPWSSRTADTIWAI